MVKNDFIDKYPDISVQEITTEFVFSNNNVLKLVNEITHSLNTAPVYFERCGKKITVFTSKKFKDAVQSFMKERKVIDPNTEETGVISCQEPYFVGGELCVRVKFGNSSDIYACDYFIPETSY